MQQNTAEKTDESAAVGQGGLRGFSKDPIDRLILVSLRCVVWKYCSVPKKASCPGRRLLLAGPVTFLCRHPGGHWGNIP